MVSIQLNVAFLRYVTFATFGLLVACATSGTTLPSPKQAYGSQPVYNYPLNDPYAATVITVPPELKVDYSNVPIPTDRTITLFEERAIPDGFWYQRGLKYAELLQKDPAPLVYIIPGTGADSQASIMRTLANILYSSGYSVVLLPSPTNPNFIINASKDFLPGPPTHDAFDIYRLIQAIDHKISQKTTVTGHMLVGYSLGAIDAAFTAQLDNTQQRINFNKILLINPPFSLYSSIKMLNDYLYSDLPNGMDGAGLFVKRVITRFSKLSHGEEALNFENEHYLLDYYTKFHPSDNQLASIIGLSFRLSAGDMIFTSDVMRHGGYVFPKDETFTTSTNLNLYLAVALRTSFLDYFNDVLSQADTSENKSLTKAEIINESSLASATPYLFHNTKIGLITNRDDIILAPGDLESLLNLFGPNAVVFPTGGHMGNIALPAMAYQIVTFMKKPLP